MGGQGVKQRVGQGVRQGVGGRSRDPEGQGTVAEKWRYILRSERRGR